MYNWSVDEDILKKNPERYAIWRLEQLINFGLNGEKISEMELRKCWLKINIDENRRRFLEVLLNDAGNFG